MNVNQAAFCTTTALSITAIGATIATAACLPAMTTAATVAAVAYGVLAALAFSLSIASITAWLTANKNQEQEVSQYFGLIKEHAGYAIVGTVKLISTVIFESLIQGIAKGISQKVTRAIGGPDQVIEHR